MIKKAKLCYKRNVDEIRLFGFLGSSAGFRWESND